MLENAPHKASRLFTDAFDLLRSKAIMAPSPTVHDYSDIEQVFRDFQRGAHVGKVVLSLSHKSIIQASSFDLHPLQFNPDATYILVGGLGGIGRALSVFMAQHGAQHLALFSRTAHMTPERQLLLDQLGNMGTQAAVYACDVTDSTALANTLNQIRKDLPQVRGVVQAAMQATGGLFETISYQTWIKGTRPKIEGTWNLHSLMPKDLDFFIMLSSIAGTSGGLGHSNYAAGCSYQDAVADYRRSLGLTAQSLDLGAVGGIGWLEDNKDSHNLDQRMGLIYITPEEIFAMFKSAVTGYSHRNEKLPSQLLSGLGSGGMNDANLAAGASHDYHWLKHSGRFAYLRGLDVGSSSKSDERGGIDIKAGLSSATSLPDAAQVVQDALSTKLAKSMMVSLEDIDASLPVSSYGVDSLVAADMRSWCFKEFRADVSVFGFLSNTSLTVLARQIAEKSDLVPISLKSSAEIS
jgi:NADP-dependent 3-hydroxy acid dehydrogenase YdfG